MEPPEDKRPVSERVEMLERLEWLTKAQQSALNKAAALERIDWTELRLQRKMTQIDRQHGQILRLTRANGKPGA
jgi:hypothetical protein